MILRSQSKSETEQQIWGVCAVFAHYIGPKVHMVFFVTSIHGSLAAELGVRTLACQTDDDYVLYIITMKRRFEMKI